MLCENLCHCGKDADWKSQWFSNGIQSISEDLRSVYTKRQWLLWSINVKACIIRSFGVAPFWSDLLGLLRKLSNLISDVTSDIAALTLTLSIKGPLLKIEVSCLNNTEIFDTNANTVNRWKRLPKTDNWLFPTKMRFYRKLPSCYEQNGLLLPSGQHVKYFSKDTCLNSLSCMAFCIHNFLDFINQIYSTSVFCSETTTYVTILSEQSRHYDTCNSILIM